MSEMTISMYNSYASSGFVSYNDQSTSNNDGIHFISSPELTLEQNLKHNAFPTQENAKYSVFEIANWFLQKESMTHKKLQKLCYYAQAWCYALMNFKLMDTTFEAWVHGPVSPLLYDRFKSFGYASIKLAGNYVPRIDANDIELLESIWKTYGDHTGNALEALSHSEQPWIEARAGYEPTERCNVPISVATMKKYYKSIYIGGDA